jgi:hypothetical protein
MLLTSHVFSRVPFFSYSTVQYRLEVYVKSKQQCQMKCDLHMIIQFYPAPFLIETSFVV